LGKRPRLWLDLLRNRQIIKKEVFDG